MVGITNDKKFQKYLLVLICYNKNTKDNFQTTYLKKKHKHINIAFFTFLRSLYRI